MPSLSCRNICLAGVPRMWEYSVSHTTSLNSAPIFNLSCAGSGSSMTKLLRVKHKKESVHGFKKSLNVPEISHFFFFSFFFYGNRVIILFNTFKLLFVFVLIFPSSSQLRVLISNNGSDCLSKRSCSGHNPHPHPLPFFSFLFFCT